MIHIKNLNFYYKKGNPIFDNISLSLKNGIYGLLGENGVGKSTFLHILCGLQNSIKGDIEILKNDPVKRNPRFLSSIYLVPEEIRESTFTLNKYADLHGVFYANYSKGKLEEYANLFKIPTNKNLKNMSMGERKKALLAFAFSVNTPILLLDEPTNGLDIPSKAQFRKILASINTENRCIIISTHQVRDLENMLDSIIIMDKREILVNNTVDEITDKLYFSYESIIPSESIYSEPILQGHSSIMKNINNLESTLNIEILFNATILNKKLIKETLKTI